MDTCIVILFNSRDRRGCSLERVGPLVRLVKAAILAVLRSVRGEYISRRGSNWLECNARLRVVELAVSAVLRELCRSGVTSSTQRICVWDEFGPATKTILTIRAGDESAGTAGDPLVADPCFAEIRCGFGQPINIGCGLPDCPESRTAVEKIAKALQDAGVRDRSVAHGT